MATWILPIYIQRCIAFQKISLDYISSYLQVDGPHGSVFIPFVDLLHSWFQIPNTTYKNRKHGMWNLVSKEEKL